MTAELDVRPELLNPFGSAHGGTLAALADHVLGSAPVAVANVHGGLSVFVRTAGGDLLHAWQNSRDGVWFSGTMGNWSHWLLNNWPVRASATNAILLMTWFGGSIHIEKVHPLESGFFRKKFRRDRRPGFPIEPAWKFYPSYFFESMAKLGRWFATYAGFRLIYMRIKRDPARYEYMDTALTPVTDEEIDTLERLSAVTAQAKAMAAHQRVFKFAEPIRVKRLTPVTRLSA